MEMYVSILCSPNYQNYPCFEADLRDWSKATERKFGTCVTATIVTHSPPQLLQLSVFSCQSGQHVCILASYISWPHHTPKGDRWPKTGGSAGWCLHLQRRMDTQCEWWMKKKSNCHILMDNSSARNVHTLTGTTTEADIAYMLDHKQTIIVPFLYDDAKISSTCSAKPMSSIWSTSSRTTCLSLVRSSLLFWMWSLMRPGVPTKMSIPLRMASTMQKEGSNSC